LDNIDVARVLYEIADYLELQGVSFKPQAYRRAANAVESLERSIDEYQRTGTLREIPGVGEAIADKISELVTTGKLQYIEKLKAETPPGLLELLSIPDVGPKTAMMLFKELGIQSVEELKTAIFDHKLQGLKGFGAKSEERILAGIRVVESRGGRSLLGNAYIAAEGIIAILREENPSAKISVAGSLRRMKETIGDIDILAASDDPAPLMDSFVSLGRVKEIIAKGETKSSVRLSEGMQVDLRVVPPASWGAALQYFTGSKEHNVELRKLAISKGMKVSEYGLFERDSGKEIAAADEEGVYAKLGLQFIQPELRESRGEIEAASRNALPELLGYDGLKGDLHCHTEWSDASGSIEELWEKAKSLGYEYVAVTDHSRSLKVASGLSESRLLEQVREVKSIRERLGPPWLFAGSEVDILGDGSLDYPRKVLSELDFAVMSVHSRFKMDEKAMTERILAAMGAEKVKVFAHPTGRLIGQRASYTFDFDKAVERARDSGIALEINSFPDRLDLGDLHVKRAIELGARISIDSDAHSPDQLEYVKYGIATARRGWAKKSAVLNAMPLGALKKEWGLS
jgi:DNA polymerase (family 10)